MRKGIILIVIFTALYVAGCGNEAAIKEVSNILSDDENVDGTITDKTLIEGAVKNIESVEKVNGKEYTYIELSKKMYATTSVNVRSGADVNFEKTGVLFQNQEVIVTGQCNETKWYKIQYEDGYGFVSNDYLSDENIVITDENTGEEAKTEEKTDVQNVAQGDWVSDLQAAQNANQIMVVAASGSTATVSMHNKNADGSWTEILSAPASIGRNGIGKSAEGDGKTPQGIYGFSFAFGIQPNPGTALSYTQVDDSYYWVDDSNSFYYNQFVSTNNVACDWNSAEHITGAGSSYNYVLAINYNSGCVPGAGSAIFLHCKPTGGAGCIAISESSMITILQNVQPGCVLIIDSTSGVYNY